MRSPDVGHCAQVLVDGANVTVGGALVAKSEHHLQLAAISGSSSEEGVSHEPCGKSPLCEERFVCRRWSHPVVISTQKPFSKASWLENKARLEALIAVARKLLHAIYGIFRSGLKYDGTKLFPRMTSS
jgi:hypothetical protein